MQAAQTVTVAGRQLKVTNLDKVLYPETGTTKAEIISYYVEIAPALMRYAEGRPVTRKRWPHGVGGDGDVPASSHQQVFFHKDVGQGAPDWVVTRTIQHSDREVRYPVIDSVATLAWFAQLAALELHVPQWRFDQSGKPRNPDRLVLDLDPGEGAGLAECAEVARLARAELADHGLVAYPVTSGSKGMHLYAALDGEMSSRQASALAHKLARRLEQSHPDLVVSDMKKSMRRGKVLVDWSQNNASKTTIAPYSLRGTPHPQVAAPRDWDEIDDPDLRHLEPGEVLTRVRERGDLLAGLLGATVDPEDEESAPDRLAAYRRKRDPDKTPEPIPAGRPAPGDGRAFVIQEHHARRLHWDLRLEHDGVLASWALPKGVPESKDKNHLAVHTEDHPMEYASFSGVIPRGEYGGGEMTIWDTGTYELHKWRDGEEVIVTLHGRAGGGLGAATKLALIHTGGGNQPENHWLIHLMERGSEQAGLSATPEPSHLPARSIVGSIDDIVDESDWTFEMDWSGSRVLCLLDQTMITLFDEDGVDVTRGYPDLLFPLRSLGLGHALLDAHVVALDEGGRPDPALLAQHSDDHDVPVFLMITDILQLDHRDLTDTRYADRHAALLELSPGDPHVQVPPAFEGTLAPALDTSRQLGLSAVIAKRNDSPYPQGTGDSWLRISEDPRAQA